MKGEKHNSKRRKKATYTAGQLNKLVDDVCHPFFKENPGFILVDGILHGMIEKDPPGSFRKFLRYNFPKIVKEITRKQKRT